MANYNKVILMGNLTRDPEVKYTTSGTARATFGVATNRVYTDRQSGEKKEEVCFVDITAFGRTAEICGEFLSKGRPVLLDGRLSFYSWETDTGEKRSKLSVVAENVQLLPRGGERVAEAEAPAAVPTVEKAESAATVEKAESAEGVEGEEEASTEDDIPF